MKSKNGFRRRENRPQGGLQLHCSSITLSRHTRGLLFISAYIWEVENVLPVCGRDYG